MQLHKTLQPFELLKAQDNKVSCILYLHSLVFPIFFFLLHNQKVETLQGFGKMLCLLQTIISWSSSFLLANELICHFVGKILLQHYLRPYWVTTPPPMKDNGTPLSCPVPSLGTYLLLLIVYFTVSQQQHKRPFVNPLPGDSLSPCF